MFFSKIFQIILIVGSTFLFFIPECLYNYCWCFSSSFSGFEERRRLFLHIYPFSLRFVILACCHPLIIIFDCGNSFQLFGAIQESSQFVSGVHQFRFIHSQLSVIILQSYRCIIQIFSYRSVIYSFHLYLNCLKYLHSFCNSSRCFFIFTSFIKILTVVHSRVLFLGYHINLFVVSILSVVHWRPSQVCAISLLILSTRISSMPNPLLVINLNWWRIGMT